MRYGSVEVFSDVDVTVDRGARIAILGLNGAGKTTLLRILAGHEKRNTGHVIRGLGARVGYYAQEHETLDRPHGAGEPDRRRAPAHPR